MNTPGWHGHATRRAAALVGCTALVLTLTAATAQARPGHHHPRDTARQTLPASDGWASHGTGTTGGRAADAEHVYTVSSWAEFKAALAAGGGAPGIIKVKGTIDAVSEGCDAFAAPGYDWRLPGEVLPGELGPGDRPERRARHQPRGTPPRLRRPAGPGHQANVPADTTIIGVRAERGRIEWRQSPDRGVDNVIVRNLTFESPVDCFPQWDPTDGDKGNWNSGVRQRRRVRLDARVAGPQHLHRRRAPRQRGAHLLRHAVPATRRPAQTSCAAPTPSPPPGTIFTEHDKTILIGNSDSESAAAGDRGHLKTTFHHNLFKDLVERAPRVRFGQVDVYNNHFVARTTTPTASVSARESQLVAEHNAFTLPGGVSPAKVLKRWNDSPLTAAHNRVNGRSADLIAAHNAENPDTPLRSGAGWTPTLRTRSSRPGRSPLVVDHGAGASRLR